MASLFFMHYVSCTIEPQSTFHFSDDIPLLKLILSLSIEINHTTQSVYQRESYFISETDGLESFTKFELTGKTTNMSIISECTLGRTRVRTIILIKKVRA